MLIKASTVHLNNITTFKHTNSIYFPVWFICFVVDFKFIFKKPYKAFLWLFYEVSAHLPLPTCLPLYLLFTLSCISNIPCWLDPISSAKNGYLKYLCLKFILHFILHFGIIYYLQKSFRNGTKTNEHLLPRFFKYSMNTFVYTSVCMCVCVWVYSSPSPNCFNLFN